MATRLRNRYQSGLRKWQPEVLPDDLPATDPASCEHAHACSVAQMFTGGEQVLIMYCPQCHARFERVRDLTA